MKERKKVWNRGQKNHSFSSLSDITSPKIDIYFNYLNYCINLFIKYLNKKYMYHIIDKY